MGRFVSPIASLVCVFVFALSTLGCSDDSGGGDAGAADSLPDFPKACGSHPVDTFQLPLKKDGEGGTYVFTLSAVDPSPIDVGNTTLSIKVEDKAGGTAIVGASSSLKPFMPEHGHGTAPPTYGGTDKGGGVYDHGPVNLMMPGVWTFTFTVTGSDQKSDKVTFAFCLEG